MTKINKDDLKNKRIVSIDYGLKRIGIAVCDQMHITTTPLKVIDKTKDDFLEEILEILKKENAGAVVVGVPYRHDDVETDFIKEIKKFIDNLKSQILMNVFEFDESFSTVRATETMISIGSRKKKRAQKGEKDKIAAAIILRDFLNELEY